jgi:hypothetical protein
MNIKTCFGRISPIQNGHKFTYSIFKLSFINTDEKIIGLTLKICSKYLWIINFKILIFLKNVKAGILMSFVKVEGIIISMFANDVKGVGVTPPILDFDTRRRSMTTHFQAALPPSISKIQRYNFTTVNTHTSAFILYFESMLVMWLIMEYQVQNFVVLLPESATTWGNQTFYPKHIWSLFPWV